MQVIRNLQTRDCYYPIYWHRNEKLVMVQYYFFDEEFEEIGERNDNSGEGYFGPYNTLDEVCKAQNRHYQSIQSL